MFMLISKVEKEEYYNRSFVYLPEMFKDMEMYTDKLQENTNKGYSTWHILLQNCSFASVVTNAIMIYQSQNSNETLSFIQRYCHSFNQMRLLSNAHFFI